MHWWLNSDEDGELKTRSDWQHKEVAGDPWSRDRHSGLGWIAAPTMANFSVRCETDPGLTIHSPSTHAK